MLKNEFTASFGPDHHLTTDLVSKLTENPKIKVSLSKNAKLAVAESRRVVDNMVKNRQVVYGITTGFGNFKNKFIEPSQVEELQLNLIRSHSTGVGEYLTPDQVRSALIVRLNSLAQGYSGVRPDFLNFLIEIINKNVIPVVPSQGSVGSSGDLAPLSHMGLVLMGRGKAWDNGKIISGAEALKKAKLKPIVFGAKEGLAWNNGTAVMTGMACLIVERVRTLLIIADLAAALSIEAVCGVTGSLDERIHKIRPHQGQILSAKNILKFLAGSKLVNSIPNRVQDSYSLRCSPQVHGASRDAISYVEKVVDVEINSVTDNPIIFADTKEAISGGNFHGEPIAIAMDTLGIAVSEIANISERRNAKLVDANTSEGLPMFLISPEKAGLNNGLMISQYTAASLVSENKVLAHPASVDSIPTSANQEDHVSMGTIATRKAWKILENAENVLAIELMTAAQALEFRDTKKLGKITGEVYRMIRSKVKKLDSDRELTDDIYAIKKLFTRLSTIKF